MRPLARKTEIIAEDLASGCVVYDGKSKKAHSLNAPLTWIWRNCDGQTDVEELGSRFEQEFPGTDGRKAVMSGLAQLKSASLLVLSSPHEATVPPAGAGTLSRRSLVAGSALGPMISSIIVPTAQAAKSKDKKDKGDDEPRPRPTPSRGPRPRN